MAKVTLVGLLILSATPIEVDGETILLETGKVYDIEAKQAKQLVHQGVADDTPANVAFHRGDMALYEKLVREAATKKSGKQGALLSNTSSTLTPEQEAAKAEAEALLEQAAVEADAEKAEALKADAKKLLEDAGVPAE
jgi:hypothetical protein